MACWRDRPSSNRCRWFGSLVSMSVPTLGELLMLIEVVPKIVVREECFVNCEIKNSLPRDDARKQ